MKAQLPERDEIRDYLLSFDTFDRYGQSQLGREYVAASLDRIIRTVQLLPRISGRVRVLELGASPYFMTCLIKRYLGYEVETANFFGDYGEKAEGEGEDRITSKRYGEAHTFRYKIFNVERDPFPYDDGEFDLVLCSEILEHLIMDPGHMLRETHRVLKPDGYLVLTTPNAVKLHNLKAMILGRNVFHAYSGFGVYGRHNREYAPKELIELLRLHNFEPKLIVDDVFPHGRLYRFLIALGPLRHRRDTLLAVTRAIGTPVQRQPGWLYEHIWSYRRLCQSRIMMGDGDALRLGLGWHEFEDSTPGTRWTDLEAIAFLKPSAQDTSLGFRAHPGPRPAKGSVRINGHNAGSFSLEPDRPLDVLLPLPEPVRAGILDGTITEIEVRFRLDSTFVPADILPGSIDHRQLGIAVEWIWLA